MKFSILIPAYKPQFLEECIESILAQTYEEWELVLVNDASPYDLDSIVKKYDDKRIRYYKREIGYGAERLVDNWNDCLSYATGDFVINMGDDDKLLSNCLMDYVELISVYPNKDLYHIKAEIINEKSEVINIQENRPETESVYSMMWHFWEGRRQWMGDWLFRITTLRRNGGFYNLPYAWGADNISAFIAAINTGVANSTKIGFSYRVSSLTISNTTHTSPKKVQAWNQVDRWYKEFFQKIPRNNEKDYDYWKLLISNRSAYINKMKREEIIQSITGNFCNLFFWINNRAHYDISWRLMYSSVVQYMKNEVLGMINNIRRSL